MRVNSWGWHTIDGVDFFVEAGRELPQLCPIKKLPSVFCPHKTTGEPIPRSEACIMFCEEKYSHPENIEVESSKLRYIGLGTLTMVKRLQKQTNYVPIVIDGVRWDSQCAKFLDLLYNEVVMSGRSVVLQGDPYIPFPDYIKIMKKKGK